MLSHDEYIKRNIIPMMVKHRRELPVDLYIEWLEEKIANEQTVENSPFTKVFQKELNRVNDVLLR